MVDETQGSPVVRKLDGRLVQDTSFSQSNTVLAGVCCAHCFALK